MFSRCHDHCVEVWWFQLSSQVRLLLYITKRCIRRIQSRRGFLTSPALEFSNRSFTGGYPSASSSSTFVVREQVPYAIRSRRHLPPVGWNIVWSFFEMFDEVWSLKSDGFSIIIQHHSIWFSSIQASPRNTRGWEREILTKWLVSALTAND